MTQKFDNRQKVAPGDTVFEGDTAEAGNGVYEDGEKLRSRYAGIVRYQEGTVSVRPSNGRYIPQEGDIVIGEVKAVRYSSWMVDLNSPYEGMMKVDGAVDEYIDLDEDELTEYYDVGDAIVVKVSSVSEGFDVNLTMDDRRCRTLESGRIEEISPSKVSALIGKGGNIIRELKEETDTSMIAGQNGRVWIQGGEHVKAAEALKNVGEVADRPHLMKSAEDLMEADLNG
jgi:RNA-binding protein Rrp4 and related proteins (contain S1 domain and KH domain)|nr:MAG: RNA-binding protein Rrp4-related protein [Candidatus Nanosalinarum sp. J07AB56]